MSKKCLFFDIESNNASKEYGMTPREFFRLGQYAWDDGEVVLTTDYDEMISVIREADYVVGHNIVSFDLSVLFGQESMEPLEMSLQNKVIDTFVLASLLKPAPYSYTNSKGHTFYNASAPEQAKKWLSLDNLCYQFGLEGKFGDLAELAKKHNPPKTLRRDLDFGLIPLDDPDFLEYARQDVIAVRSLYHHLVNEIKTQEYDGGYVWREMIVWAINTQISKNGVRVNIPEAQDRVEELAKERDKIMEYLVGKFGFPTTGKQPWKSSAGKQAILDALKMYGITPKNPAWTKTAKGAPSFSGDTMKAVTEGTEAEKLGESLAILQGQRSLAQLALESVKEDGKAHPSIMCLQRSGRSSTQKPGLTVWTDKGPNRIEKRYFIASPGHKMVEMDYSNADQRVVAAYSGDVAYKRRFDPGADGHEINGRLMFGDEVYDSDPKKYRDLSKAPGHAYTYGASSRKLASTSGLSIETMERFIRGMEKTYPLVIAWQNRVRDEGESGVVENDWGRRMPVDPGRSWTQSPAMIGQSGTREIMMDGLISIARADMSVLRYLVMTVHDAVVWDFPENNLDWLIEFTTKHMTQIFKPKHPIGQEIEFTMTAGKPGDSWLEAGHG